MDESGFLLAHDNRMMADIGGAAEMVSGRRQKHEETYVFNYLVSTRGAEYFSGDSVTLPCGDGWVVCRVYLTDHQAGDGDNQLCSLSEWNSMLLM